MIKDLAIIGAGPLGIELAVALKRAGVDYVQFDAGQVGQTISWFPPQTRFFSSNERIAIAGVPLQTPDQTKATREQYLAYLRSIVLQFDLPIRTYERVIGIKREPTGGFTLTTFARGSEHTCRVKRIVLATGGTAHPRRLGCEGEDLPHVHRFWKDPHAYFRTKVLVIGGKNSAVETALRLHHAGAHVMLSYRGSELPAKSIKYWLVPEILSYIKHGQIPAYFSSVVKRIEPGKVLLAMSEDKETRGQGDKETAEGERQKAKGKRKDAGDVILRGVLRPEGSSRGVEGPLAPDAPPTSLPDPSSLSLLRMTTAGQSEIRNPRCTVIDLDADFVIPQIGYVADMSLARLAGVELQGEREVPLFNPETMETNVPGVYICGTAIGGTQEKYEVFIENGHVHVDKIVAHITGAGHVTEPAPYSNPES